jgi:hypothetical protein
MRKALTLVHTGVDICLDAPAALFARSPASHRAHCRTTLCSMSPSYQSAAAEGCRMPACPPGAFYIRCHARLPCDQHSCRLAGSRCLAASRRFRGAASSTCACACAVSRASFVLTHPAVALSQLLTRVASLAPQTAGRAEAAPVAPLPGRPQRQCQLPRSQPLQ